MSSSTGVVLDWEKKAIDGDEMPDGLNMFEAALFIALRGLYHHLRNGYVTREVAVREKTRLLREYQNRLFLEEQCKRYVQTIKNTEVARSEYRKNRTIENADKLLIAFEGVC